MTATRKFVAIVFVLTLLLYITGTARSASVELVLPDAPVNLGSAFDVQVIAHSDSDSDLILAFGFDAYFDTEHFLFLGASVSNEFKDTSANFTDTDVAGIAFPPVSSDSVLLAILTFQPIQEGTGWLGIYSDVDDDNEGLFLLRAEKQDISTISEVEISAVPIPSTLVLIITGFVGILVFKKRSIDN